MLKSTQATILFLECLILCFISLVQNTHPMAEIFFILSAIFGVSIDLNLLREDLKKKGVS